MGRLHERIINSEFRDRYMAIQKRIPRIKHLFHGGAESYHAGLEIEHLLSAGFDRLSNESIERTMVNLEIGLDRIMGQEMIEGELYIDCHSRPPDGEKTREAVWLYRIFANYEPVAAIGVNLHSEYGELVATVANIQGHDSDGVKCLRQICGETPWPIVSLRLILEHLPEDISIVRGVPSGNHPFKDDPKFDKHRASNLYDRTFVNIGMDPIRDTDTSLKYYELHR